MSTTARYESEVRALRAVILGADPRIREEEKWNAPSFRTSEHFATLHLRGKHGIQVILHLGAKPQPGSSVRADVADPAGLLEWKGADRAVATFADAADIDAKRAAFTAIIRQWLQHVPDGGRGPTDPPRTRRTRIESP